MKKLSKKILATLMVFAMVFGSVPAWATVDIEITDTSKHDPNYSNTDYVGIDGNVKTTIGEDEVNSIKTGVGGVASDAYGIQYIDSGTLSVGSLTGGISLTSTKNADGMYIMSSGMTTISGLGSITVSGAGSHAEGIYTEGPGNTTVTFTGSDSFIEATNTGTDTAIGIDARISGTMTINNLGKITAKTEETSNASTIFGIYYSGSTDTSALNVAFSGADSSIEATSAGTGEVYGISTSGSGKAYIGQYTNAEGNVVGDGIKSIIATTNGSEAMGIVTRDNANTTVTFAGSDSFIEAEATGSDQAVGIEVESSGTTTVNNLGSIMASSAGSYAQGICIYCDGITTVTFTGSDNFITAENTGTGGAFGIYAYAWSSGTTTVNNLGKITAKTDNATSSSTIYGIYYSGSADTSALNVAFAGTGSSIEATSKGTGVVCGIRAQGSGTTTVSGLGSITASSVGGSAYGIQTAGTGDTTVTFIGSDSFIEATNTAGAAFGIAAVSLGTTTVSGLGGMTVSAAGGVAIGIGGSSDGDTNVTFCGENSKVNVAGKTMSIFLFANNTADMQITGASSRTKVTFTGATKGVSAIKLNIPSASKAPQVTLTNMDITDSVLNDSGNYAIYAQGVSSSTVSTVTLKNTLLNGDVALKDANAKLKVEIDSASTLTGNFVSNGGNLEFINNGTWYPVFDDSTATSSNTVTTITLGETGIINMNTGSNITTERALRKLNINGTSFTSNGGTFVINTDIAHDTGDVIDLNGFTTVTGDAKVQVMYDPCFKTGATVTGNHKFLLLPNTSTEDSLKVTALTTDYNGVLYTPTLAYDGATSDSNGWKITSVKAEANNTAKAVGDTANVQNFVWLETVNNLQKRLGDLRGGEASDMAWARFQRNNDDYDGARPFNVSGNMYQVGYDFALHNQVASRGYFGVSLEAFDGTQSYEIGGGDVKSMSLGAYYTKIYDSGHYFDFILRYGRQESDSTSYDASLLTPTLTKLDYAMNSVTLSGEYGYRANLGKSGLYLEPQAEFIYGYLSGAKATSSTNILADIDSTNHFVTRLGLAFGQRVKNFNYYLRGSYYHDFAGTTHVKYGDASYKQDSAQNWWEVSLGGGWNISKVSYFYAELIKHFKDVSNSLNFNVGFRFTL